MGIFDSLKDLTEDVVDIVKAPVEIAVDTTIVNCPYCGCYKLEEDVHSHIKFECPIFDLIMSTLKEGFLSLKDEKETDKNL